VLRNPWIFRDGSNKVRGEFDYTTFAAAGTPAPNLLDSDALRETMAEQTAVP
jgi:hypothetical protein